MSEFEDNYQPSPEDLFHNEIVLALPKDNPKRVRQLELKLEEYQERLFKAQVEDPYKAPEYFAQWYPVYILEALLEKRSINSFDLSRDMLDSNSRLDKKLFWISFTTIKDYVETGGKNVHGGTGLPKVD